MKKHVLVVCQHGDEKAPLEVILDHFPEAPFVVANQVAFDQNERFIESDMNRSFPGDQSGSLEERLAKKLLEKIKDIPVVIDLHTATVETPIFAIVTKLTKKHLDLVQQVGVKKVVYMEESIASGKALIDHVILGISLECGKEGKKETYQAIKQSLTHFYDKRSSKKSLEIFSVFNILKRKENEELTAKTQSFHRVQKGDLLTTDGQTAQVSFYPVLPRERYPGVLCLMAKKLSDDTIAKII